MKENDLLCASIIMQGLLASGHYTYITKGDKDEPSLKHLDWGEDWKEDGFKRRIEPVALVDAVSLLNELKEKLK